MLKVEGRWAAQIEEILSSSRADDVVVRFSVPKCVICNGEFEKVAANQKFCSRSCQNQAAYQRKTETKRRPPAPVVKDCRYCQKPYVRLVNQQRFCTTFCRDRAYGKLTGRPTGRPRKVSAASEPSKRGPSSGQRPSGE